MVDIWDTYYRVGAQARQNVQGLFDQQAKRQAGGLLGAGQYDQAAGVLGGAGLLEEAGTVREDADERSDKAALQARQQKKAEMEAATAAHKQNLDFMEKAANVLLQIPEESRAEVFQKDIANALRGMGADDDVIQQTIAAGFSDATLQTFSGQIAKAKEQFTLSPGSKRFAADGSLIAEAPFAPEYRSVGAGETLIELGTGGGGASAGGGSSQPRNVRNNNPGNIEDGPFAKSLPGYKGSDGRFAIFETPEAGAGAQTALLASYGKRGLNTVGAIINRWAPPSENDSAGYARFVAQKLGVSPDTPLNMSDPKTLQALAGAIKQFEGGPSSNSNGGGGARVVARGAPKEEERWVDLPGGGQVNTRTGEKKGAGGSAKITDGMRNTASLAKDMLGANDQINTLADQGIFKPTAQVLVSEKNGVTRLVARNPRDAQFVAAANAFLIPLLRKETGAAVTAGELTSYMDTYIPQPSDTPQLIRQKAAARRTKMVSILNQSRPAFEDQFGPIPPQVVTKYQVYPGHDRKGGSGGSAPAASANIPVYDINGRRVK